MTHEELLDCIDKFDAAVIIGQPAIKALRAVVELHKPSEATMNDKQGCKVCCIQNAFIPYPCPTIQAIEKELK